ncbi:MAG: ATP-binding protein [Candidatus Omnitrophica bacterium]|nr:ATP-binding protein [Candidatus Omnitrophota bacterium]
MALRPQISPRVQAGLEEALITSGLVEGPAETEFLVRPEMTKTELEKIVLRAIRDLGEKIRRFRLFRQPSPVELDLYRNEEVLLDNQELDVKIRGSDQGARDSSIALAHAMHNSVDAVAARARHFHQPQRGAIQFRVRETQRYLILELSDNGIGIDARTLEDLFARQVTTKDKLSNRWIGGEGEAIHFGYYGNYFLRRWKGMIVIETRHLSDRPELLRYVPLQPLHVSRRDLRRGRRREMGTTLRWVFPKEIFSAHLSGGRPAIGLPAAPAGLEEPADRERAVELLRAA